MSSNSGSPRRSASRPRPRSMSRPRSSDAERGDEYRRFSDVRVSSPRSQSSPRGDVRGSPRRGSMEIERVNAMPSTPKSSPLRKIVSALRSSPSFQQQASPRRSNSTRELEMHPSRSFSTDRGSACADPQSAPPTRNHKGFSTPFARILQTLSGPSVAARGVPADLESDWHEHLLERRSSHLRTDLCSLTLFGVLQSDHTRYLFAHVRPPTLFKRLCLHLVVPAGLFCAAGWFSGHIYNDYVNNLVCTTLVWFVVLWIAVGCARGRKKRVMVREEILWRLKRREERFRGRREVEADAPGGRGRKRRCGDAGGAGPDEDYEYYSEDEEEYERRAADLGLSMLGQTRWEMNCAHRTFGCYPSDVRARSDGTSSSPGENDYMLQNNMQPGTEASFCTKLWTSPCLPCIPCGNGSYGCHPQFCGLCAIAQEAREANLTLPRHLRMVDYITMEPFLLYYPKILELRRNKSKGLVDHCRALSRLSVLLLKAWGAILVILLALSMWDAVGYWKLRDMAVLCATFLQAFVVMWAVHWGWHRFDLSVDAVVKYFACGFALCTCIAFTSELLIAGAFRLVVFGVVSALGVTEVVDNGYGGMKVKFDEWGSAVQDQGRRALSEDTDILYGFFKAHPIAKIIYVLVSSYLVCGVIDELCKYFGFLMVDHPDFCSEKELTKAHSSLPLQLLRDRADDEEDAENEHRVTTVVREDEATSLANFDAARQRRSSSSIRAGVTVAMVAVALGFACCENLLHIFIYNRSSLKSEIGVLVVKSLFPIHPLCAAIQSIQICKRDLERDTSIGISRIVLSSVFLHGTYDAALLLLNESWQRSQKEQYFYEGSNGNNMGVALMSAVTSMLILATGFLYFMIRSRAQYSRLRGKQDRAEVAGISLETGILA